MGAHEFTDVLAGSVVTIEGSSFSSKAREGEGAPGHCRSLFFPGCSFLNYAPDLVLKTYELLEERGYADGISVLCCGKILAFEELAETVKPAFQQDLAGSLRGAGVERIVAACPNCMEELRKVLAGEGLADSVEVVPLPQALSECDCMLSADQLVDFLRNRIGVPDGRQALVSIHDSCPDRALGEFAGSIRTMIGEEVVSELAHNRRLSICCGSLANAAGRPEAARKIAENRGTEAREAHAAALMTYCMSCAYMLSSRQSEVPVFHYLEALFDTRIDWAGMPPAMALRFLFEELQGTRTFAGGRA